MFYALILILAAVAVYCYFNWRIACGEIARLRNDKSKLATSLNGANKKIFTLRGRIAKYKRMLEEDIE